MLSRRQLMAFASAGVLTTACSSTKAIVPPLAQLATVGVSESFDPRFDALIAPGTKPEIIVEGMDWSEGPAWDKRRERLLFSDVPQNRVYSWSRDAGLDIFLEPAGAPHGKPYADMQRGTNGLWYQDDDTLLMCNQAGRSIDRLDLETGRRTIIVDNDGGKPLNKPNDVVASSNGIIYFTNPPIGLGGTTAAEERFLDYSAVYRAGPEGLSIVTRELQTPNGIALSPDERTLYVAQSGKVAPKIMRYFLDESGNVTGSDLFFDVQQHPIDGQVGTGDGMSVDRHGNLFFCAVDIGTLVISSQGDLLGRIFTGRKMSNCVFGEDGSTLFITADDLILRVPTLTRGMTFS